jgi:hypothetical protein
MSDVVIPVGRLGAGSPQLFGALADCLAAEGDRRPLWLPVFSAPGSASTSP